MHELSIAQNLVELACEHASRQGAARVRVVRVRLGVLSGMLKPLCFCFSAVSKNTLCEGARLEIEDVPLTVICPACDETRTPSSLYSFRCSVCGTPTPKVVTGREMQLVSLELETTPVPLPKRRRERLMDTPLKSARQG